MPMDWWNIKEFLDFLNNNSNRPLNELTDELFKILQQFGNDANLRDDISFLTFWYRGTS
jgi:hypothetical protein